MSNILELGKQGAEEVIIDIPKAGVKLEDPLLAKLIARFNRIPPTEIDQETYGGVRESVEVRQGLLDNPVVFNTVRQLAIFGPMVYAQKAGQEPVKGVLLANLRRHSIMVQPLRDPLPLIRDGQHQFLPNEEEAVMLAAAARATVPGVGNHDVAPTEDYEHVFTILGAASLGRTTILGDDDRHIQHGFVAQSSLGYGLSGGSITTHSANGEEQSLSLGSLFVPSTQTSFNGYAKPIVFHQDKVTSGDRIAIPTSFLGNERAWALTYDEAPQLALGAAYNLLHTRLGEGQATENIHRIEGNLAA